MDSNNETLKDSSVKLRKSGQEIHLIPSGSRSSTPVNLASKYSSTPDNLTPNNLTPDNLTPDNLTLDNLNPDNLIPENLTPNNLTPDNLNLSQNIRPQTVQLGQFDSLSFNPEPIQAFLDFRGFDLRCFCFPRFFITPAQISFQW